MGYRRSPIDIACTLPAAVARLVIVLIVPLGCQQPAPAAPPPPPPPEDGGPPTMGIITKGGCYVATPLPEAVCTNSAAADAGAMAPDDTCVHFRVEGVRATRPTSPPLMVQITSPSTAFNPSSKELPKGLGETAVPIEFDTVIDAKVTDSSAYKIFLSVGRPGNEYSGVIEVACRRP